MHTIIETSARAFHDDDVFDQSSALNLVRRTRLSVVERERDVLASRFEQIAWNAQARNRLGRTQAVAALNHFTCLHDREASILQNETQLVREFPSVIVELRKPGSHGQL